MMSEWHAARRPPAEELTGALVRGTAAEQPGAVPRGRGKEEKLLGKW